MENLQFYQLLNTKQKATSNTLVHRFLECYDVENKCFRVKDQVISFDVSDIARITGLSDSGEPLVESSSFLETPSWYYDLCHECVHEDERERRKKDKTKNMATKYKQGEKTKSKWVGRKAIVVQILNNMSVETEARLNFRKMLSFYLISYFVAAPSDGYGH